MSGTFVGRVNACRDHGSAAKAGIVLAFAPANAFSHAACPLHWAMAAPASLLRQCQMHRDQRMVLEVYLYQFFLGSSFGPARDLYDDASFFDARITILLKASAYLKSN